MYFLSMGPTSTCEGSAVVPQVRPWAGSLGESNLLIVNEHHYPSAHPVLSQLNQDTVLEEPKTASLLLYIEQMTDLFLAKIHKTM